MDNLDQWNRIIEELRGTCLSLSTVLDREEALDLEDHMPFLNYLDSNIFCCEQCMWWCELSEMADNDQWECRDCADSD